MTARLVAHLAELERRQLFAPSGYSSLYAYCREALGYSEDAAYNRSIARPGSLRRYPASILDMLADGRLSPTTVKLLAPALTDSNCDAVLSEAAGASKRDVEELVARLSPGRTCHRRCGSCRARACGGGRGRRSGTVRRNRDRDFSRSMAPPAVAGGAAPKPDAAAGETAGGEAAGARALPRPVHHRRRDGEEAAPPPDPVEARDPGRRSRRALRPRAGLRSSPPSREGNCGRRRDPDQRRMQRIGGRAGLRHVPARTRRVVSLRDEERCAFVGLDGRRCTERAFLEYHHGPVPFGHGGAPTPVNIALHCARTTRTRGEGSSESYLPKEIREARVLYDAMRFAVPERP